MTKRRFSAQQSTILRDLRKVIDDMRATSLRVNQDIFEGTAEIIFDRAGQRYVFRCQKYTDPLDNLRAAQLTISYLWRALVEYGVEQSQQEVGDQLFAQFFLGFSPTPDDTALMLPSGKQEWWEILGVPADASREAIVNAYRALAKRHHPDVGGDPDAFKRLVAAYEQGIKGAK